MACHEVAHNLFILSQFTSVQFILTTDGTASFATFIYEGIVGIDRPVNYQIGFDAGDQRNSAVIERVGKFPLSRSTAIYRIDG